MDNVDGVDGLFEREYIPLVRSLSVAFDAESAADAVQEAFIAASWRWSRVSSYDDPAAWVRRVAINRLLNGHRNARRQAEVLVGIRLVGSDDLTVELLDLRAAIAHLPRAMKLSICLYYLADMSVDEIAYALDISAGTVKSNLHDARIKLRSLLGEDTHE
jgi:RNA polymerase sigma-70 factor, ECF subfamily